MEYSIEQKPLISVILPIRDVEEFLASCLDSILNQNYQNLEIIAIDDFSRDQSLKILKQYKRQDSRLKIYKNVKKYGLAITLNRCLKRAKGKFIVFMDARDTITKNKLQKQLDFLLKNTKVVGVGTQCMYITEDNKRIGKSNFPPRHDYISQQPLHGVSVLVEGIMINKYKIPKDLLFFPTHKHFFLYTDMAIKLMQYGELANLPEFLHCHRKHTYTIQSTTSHVFSLARLWISSRFNHDETPPLRSFFSGILKPSTT